MRGIKTPQQEFALKTRGGGGGGGGGGRICGTLRELNSLFITGTLYRHSKALSWPRPPR